jgi:hypothetical protein
MINKELLIKWSEYPPSSTIKPTTQESKNTRTDTSINIWSCFAITKNPDNKISMNDVYLHYKKNTLNPLTKIQFGKELSKKEGISKGFLYIGKNKNGNDYCIKCWCGLKLKSITSNKEENTQQKSYLIDL